MLVALVASFTATAVQSAAPICNEQLNAATGSIRASRIRLEKAADDEEICAAFRDLFSTYEAARIVFRDCLEGQFRTEMVRDTDRSIADLRSTLVILCGGT